MSEGLDISMLLLIGLCIVLETAREVCFKKAANNTAVLDAIGNPITWLGIGFWGAELICWTLVLQQVPLSIAFPLMALVYVAIVMAGAVFLGERFNLRHAIGALLITAGAACVGATSI